MSRFFITNSGVRVYPENLGSLKINLEDIAHHLTKIQRFGGSMPLNVNYSVADHSITLARYAHVYFGSVVAKAALMHDASEAYLGDIVSPLKGILPDYCNLEEIIERKIKVKYRLSERTDVWEIVKLLDRRILLDEVQAILPRYYDEFKQDGLEPLGINIPRESNQKITKNKFLFYCTKLGVIDG